MKLPILFLKIVFLFFIIFLVACNNRPFKVQEALKQMKSDNRQKFEKVFEHYRHPGDSLKLKAAYFLVENMNGLGYYKGRQIDDYNNLFDILANKPADYRENVPWYSDNLISIFDSLKSLYGPMDFRNFYFVKDEDVITTEFLIKYIDESFEAWNNPWSAKVVSFDDFCNYVLPYRSLKEPLEPWREMFKKKFLWIKDSVKPNEDIINVAQRLNINSELSYSNGFGNYIVSIPPSLLLKAMYGDCSNTSNYKAMIMRAHGIPATIDFMPQYGTDHNIHSWNSVMDRNGNFVSFEEALNDINASVAYKYKISKVYRRTFSKNEDNETLLRITNEDVPQLFKEPRFIDVTSHYVPVTNVKIQLKNIPKNISYVYVGVFNDTGWTIMDYAKIIDNQFAEFKKLGRDVIYMPLYFINGEQIVAASAFKISSKGYIQYLEPQKRTTTVNLIRKYHMHKQKTNWLKCLKGASFEGANQPDFSDAVTLAKINKVPGEHFQQLTSNSNRKFRYVRLVYLWEELTIAYDGDGASIAEIEFISPSGQVIHGEAIGSPGRKYNKYVPKNCFDGNPLTFFEDARLATRNKYVGLRLDKPTEISKIRFLARNDMNSIQLGNEYELFYWDNKSFKSLGKKIANDTIITFNDVPKSSVLWLRNLTEGKEERIFTWEGEKQVWW